MSSLGAILVVVVLGTPLLVLTGSYAAERWRASCDPLPWTVVLTLAWALILLLALTQVA